MQESTKNKSLLAKIASMAADVAKLREGSRVNIGKLSDQRFGSKFSNLRYGTGCAPMRWRSEDGRERKRKRF